MTTSTSSFFLILTMLPALVCSGRLGGPDYDKLLRIVKSLQEEIKELKINHAKEIDGIRSQINECKNLGTTTNVISRIDTIEEQISGLRQCSSFDEARKQCFFGEGAGEVFFEGVNVHIRNGLHDTNTINAKGNLIIGYDEGESDEKTGSHNLVVGAHHKYTSYGGLVSGENNEITGVSSTVVGGTRNTAGGYGSLVSGGTMNDATGPFSVVYGGEGNKAAGPCTSLVGEVGQVVTVANSIKTSKSSTSSSSTYIPYNSLSISDTKVTSNSIVNPKEDTASKNNSSPSPPAPASPPAQQPFAQVMISSINKAPAYW